MAQEIDLDQLRRFVQEEIKNYRHEGPSAQWFLDHIPTQLQEMTKALVEPYWLTVQLRNTHEQLRAEPAISRECVVVADDGFGYIVVYDPVEGIFCLAASDPTGKRKPSTFGMCGDPVECFVNR